MIRELAAEALFASPLQPSWNSTTEQVSAAVEATILLHGSEGCAELLAQEFGDHPEAARNRMNWCLAAVRFAFVPAGAAS